jgi:hypothetical protein
VEEAGALTVKLRIRPDTGRRPHNRLSYELEEIMSTAAFLRTLGAATVLSVALTACNDDDPVSPPVVDPAAVYVVHGISGLDMGVDATLPVDIRLDNECVATNVTFGTISQELEVTPATYTVEVRLANQQDPCSGAVAAAAQNVVLEEGQNVTLFAHLNTAGEPTLTRFSNDLTAQQDVARAVARHGAAFGPVDVLIDQNIVFSNLASGQEQSTVLAPGTYQLTVTAAGATEPEFQVIAPFQAGLVYIAYAVGTPENDTFDVLLQQIPMQ